MTGKEGAYMQEPVLQLQNICKRFVGVIALDHVSFTLSKGEILAILGENGAGKSTLMKILSGVYPCGSFEGDILLNGEKMNFHGPKEAEKAGVVMIPQELSLEQDLSITENIMLGKLPKNRLGFIDWEAAHKTAKDLLKELGIAFVDVQMPARSLSSSMQQLVSIARALYCKPHILILDEPTSCLTQSETEIVFTAIRKLRENGVSCLYISHKLNEVFTLCDRVIVLRDGQYVSEHTRDAFKSDVIIHDIVGKALDTYQKNIRTIETKEILRVEHFAVVHPYSYGKMIVEDASFSLYEGEILGLCGLVGSGRSELLGAIFGAVPKRRGTLVMKGKPVKIRQPADAKKIGIGMLTEDRKRDGLVECLSVRENISLTILKMLKKGIFLNRTKERSLVESYVQRLRIKTTGTETKIGTLSGGNQQKAIVAKWLATDMKILILDEPTRGIDVGTKREMYQLIRSLAQNGLSIIVASSEMSELLQLCDRFVILAGGRIKSVIPGAQATEELLLKECSQL